MNTPVLNIQLQIDLRTGTLELKTAFSQGQAEKRHLHLLALLRELRRLQPQAIAIHAIGLHEAKAIAQLLLKMVKVMLPRCKLKMVETELA